MWHVTVKSGVICSSRFHSAGRQTSQEEQFGPSMEAVPREAVPREAILHLLERHLLACQSPVRLLCVDDQKRQGSQHSHTLLGRSLPEVPWLPF